MTSTWRPGRVRLFRILCLLVALALSPSLAGVAAPWTGVNPAGFDDPEAVRWSIALEGSVDLLIAACLVIAAVRPDRAASPLRVVAAALVLVLLVVLPFAGPTVLMIAAMLALPLVSYPAPGTLVTWPPGEAGPRLLVPTVAAGVLVAVAVDLLRQQVGVPLGSSPDLNIAATDAEHVLILAAAGLLLVGRRTPIWATTVLASVWGYLGVASLVLHDADLSWGVAGGVACLAAAALFAATALIGPSTRMTGTALRTGRP